MTACSPVHYAVVGTGMMGIEHIRYIDLLDGAELVALCDPHRPSLDAALDAAGRLVATYDHPRSMMEEADVDAVVVASPNHSHHDVLAELWDSDCHLLVEKPLCTTMDDARRVARRASSSTGVFWVGMEYRYMAPIERLRAELAGGAVGDLHMLFLREHRFPFLPKVGDWNRFSRNSGGTLVEKCCHHFDLMRLLIGSEPVRVAASAGQDVNHLDESYDGETPDILDNAFVLVDFENGVRATLDLCMFAEAGRHQEEITATGSAGKVECFLPASTLVRSERASGRSERVDIPAPPGVPAGHHHASTYFEHVRFLRAVRGEGPVEVSADDGLRAVAMGVAAQIAAAEHRVVAMSEVLGDG